MTRGSLRATRFCIPTNPYHRRSDSSRQWVRSVGHVDQPVDGHRVMAGADDRPAVVHQTKKAAAKGLVVVDDVELAPPASQQNPNPQAEG